MDRFKAVAVAGASLTVDFLEPVSDAQAAKFRAETYNYAKQLGLKTAKTAGRDYDYVTVTMRLTSLTVSSLCGACTRNLPSKISLSKPEPMPAPVPLLILPTTRPNCAHWQPMYPRPLYHPQRLRRPGNRG